ncbi:MAG: ABC transporter permease [Candidatus Omnitrophica bacterium]|nr:ABC transporter permease [Candidatus Omnitrophota bacterium]
MIGYLARRLLGLIPVLLGITLISFGVMKLAPGKPTDAAVQFNPKASFEARERMEKLLGLDQPLHRQYLRWLGRVVRFDFEVRPGGLFDRLTTVLVFIGYSAPGFWLALLAIGWFGVTLRWFPVSGLHAIDHEAMGLLRRGLDVAWHLALPVGVMTFVGLAGLSRYARSGMIEVLRQDYIRTARAKGLPERRVLFRHGLRNALLPIITILGLSLPDLIAGSVVMETVFSIPGMGRLFYDAVMARDQNVVMALVTIGALLTLLGNLLADLAYAYADPRIRVRGGR